MARLSKIVMEAKSSIKENTRCRIKKRILQGTSSRFIKKITDRKKKNAILDS